MILTVVIVSWLTLGLIALVIVLSSKAYWESVKACKTRIGFGWVVYDFMVGSIILSICGPFALLELSKRWRTLMHESPRD